MNRNIWIGIAVVVVIAAGAWWYLNKSNTSSTSVTQIPADQTTQQNGLSAGNSTANQPAQTSQQTHTTSNTSAQASANLPITMTVTPNSGSAPVAVTISGSGNLYYGNLKLDFGDGNETPIYGNSISSDQYGNNQVLHSSHTYTSPGTYTIQLLGQECAGAPSPTCGSFSTIGTVTITVQ